MDAKYTVKIDRVYGLTKDKRTWSLVDVVDVKTSILVATYHEIEIGLIDFLGREFTFNFSDYLSYLANFTGTFGAWLDSMAGKTLDMLRPGLPILNFGKTYYVNLAGRATTAMCPRNTHPSQDFAMEDANDVVIDDDIVYGDHLAKYALYNVNGSWVHSRFDGENVRLYNAGRIIKRTSNVNVGALSFYNVGTVKTTLLKDLNVSLLRDDVPHQQNTLIISGLTATANKTYMLSVCGVLFDLERGWVFGERGITVPVGRLDLVELFISTRHQHDWSDIIDLDINVNVDLLRSRETLMSILKHESCFVVEVDNANMYRVREEHLEKMKVGHCKYPIQQDLGFIVGNDRLSVSYMPISSGKYWDLYFVELPNDYHIRKSTGWETDKWVTTKQDLLTPFENKTYSMFNYRARVAPFIE